MARLGKRIRTTLDYRFLIGLIILAVVATICWGFIQRTKENADLAHSARTSASSISILTAQVDVLSQQLEAQRVEAHKAAVHASQQRALLRKQNRALAHALARMLDILKANGIQVPASLISDIRTGGGGGASSKHHQRRPAPPAVGPGNSGTHPCAHSRKC